MVGHVGYPRIDPVSHPLRVVKRDDPNGLVLACQVDGEGTTDLTRPEDYM
jgi:hypothetical protein